MKWQFKLCYFHSIIIELVKDRTLYPDQISTAFQTSIQQCAVVVGNMTSGGASNMMQQRTNGHLSQPMLLAEGERLCLLEQDNLSSPLIALPFCLCRYNQFWDYRPQVGLVVAGGHSPDSPKLNISRDLGKSADTMANIPYQYSCSSRGRNYIDRACLIIINETTIFTAGGYGEWIGLGGFWVK